MEKNDNKIPKSDRKAIASNLRDLADFVEIGAVDEIDTLIYAVKAMVDDRSEQT